MKTLQQIQDLVAGTLLEQENKRKQKAEPGDQAPPETAEPEAGTKE